MMTGGGDGLSTFASGICKPSDENSDNTQPGMLQQSEARHFIQGYLHFHAADEQRSSHLVQVTSQYYSTTQSFCKDIAEKKSTCCLLRCAQSRTFEKSHCSPHGWRRHEDPVSAPELIQ